MAKLVAVTACPPGIAHTGMGAAALRRTAPPQGDASAAATQGSHGVRPRPSAAGDAVAGGGARAA
ncbi:hypothetical protein GAY28_35390, partial [Azospirillum brasilense]|nr:hypothetical protein [Azospirillum brasilense]